ncbi:MAG: phage tail tape measure protein, partial [Halobacteriota archaeon]|nr:phage tail tape measure protein [Halobacteriota archaeon]
GFYMMRSAGFDAAKVIEELPAVANMAVAGNMEMADAVSATTMVLDSYGDQAGSATDITNVLVGTVQGFKTTLPELQMQLSKNIGVAASLGVSFEELAAMSGLLKKDFVGAEEAGTALKTMMLRLTDASKAEALEELGVSVKDANGNFVGMQTVLDELSVALAGAEGNVQQMTMLQEIFGAEGVRAAQSLVRQKDSLAEYTEQVGAGTSVQEALNAQLESTTSQLEIAKNKTDAAKIAMGEAMAPATILAADAMAKFAGVITTLPEGMQTTIGTAIKMSESFAAIGPAIMGVSTILPMLQNANLLSIPGLVAHAAAAWAMVAPYLAIAAPVIAVIAVFYLLEKKFGVVTKVVELVKEGMSVFVDWLKAAFVSTIERTKEIVTSLAEKFNETKDRIQETVSNIKDVVGRVWDFISAPFIKIIKFLNDLRSQFRDAGRNIIQSLVDGIKSIINKPVELVRDALAKVRNMLPFSPAKEGPLSKLPNWDSYLVEPIEKTKISKNMLFEDNIASSGGIQSASSAQSVDNSIHIGNVNLSADYPFETMMRDIETYERNARIQRGIR